MATLSLINNKYAHLVFYTDEKIIHHTFHKELDSETLRHVLNTGIDLLNQYEATKWLSDNRAIEPHSENDTNWINNDWLPRVIAAGWKYWALVVPDDVMAQMNMVEFVNMFYDRGVRVMVSSDLDEARTWLTNVDRQITKKTP